MAKTVAVVLQERLYEYGVRHVFGIIGRESSAIAFDEVKGIEFILTRHEFTAAVMAGVLATLTGRPQACFATLGPGMTNLCTGVGTALLDRFPLIALSAQAETYDCVPGQTHQCLDNTAVMGSITKYAGQLERPEDVVKLVDASVASSMTEPCGPSFLSLPVDQLTAELPDCAQFSPVPGWPAAGSSAGSAPQDKQVAEIAALLADAAHPLVVVGVATLRAGATPAIRAFVERLRIPVVSTYGAKGVLAHDHPLNYGAFSAYLDSLLGFPATDYLFGPVDLVLALGYDYAEDLRPAEWTRGRPKKTVRVAPVANPVPQLVEPDIDAVSDVMAFIKTLDHHTAGLAAKTPHDIEPLRARITTFLADPTTRPNGMGVHQIIDTMNFVLPGDILVSDIGFFRHYAGLFARTEQPYGFITSAGCSSFGFGLPAAMAAKIARPDQHVVLIAGDGGFHSGSADLETAARLGLDIAIIVVNNSRNGLIELYQNLGQGRSHAPTVEFTPVDFARLAQANGCHGLRATDRTSLTAALYHAKNLTGPVVIDVASAYDFHAENFNILTQIRLPGPE